MKYHAGTASGCSPCHFWGLGPSKLSGFRRPRNDVSQRLLSIILYRTV